MKKKKKNESLIIILFMGTKLAWMQRCASPQGQLTMVKSFLNLKYKCTQTCYFMQTLNFKNLSFLLHFTAQCLIWA